MCAGNRGLAGSILGMLSIGFSDGLYNTNDDNFIPFNDTNAIAMTEQADLPIENNLRRLIERKAQGIVIARNTQFSKQSNQFITIKILIYAFRSWQVNYRQILPKTREITTNIANQNNVQH